MWSIGFSEYGYLITTPFTMFVAFYYYGFGFIDYINERRRMNIEQSVIQKKEKKFVEGPKWKKFFEKNENIQVDINRSIKIENVDVFFNFLKVNGSIS